VRFSWLSLVVALGSLGCGAGSIRSWPQDAGDGEADAGSDGADDAGSDGADDAGEDAGADGGADAEDGGDAGGDDGGGPSGCTERAIREEDCPVENGTGRRTTTCTAEAWVPGDCQLVACEAGFFPHEGACLPSGSETVHAIEPKADQSSRLEVTLAASFPAQSFTLDRVQKNGSPVTLPAHAALDPSTGVFVWTPTPSQVAFYVFEVTAGAAGGQSEPLRLLVDVTLPPICTEAGEDCAFLQARWQAGEAAGHLGDWYYNCDGFHTRLSMRLFPQLDLMTTGGCDTEYGTYPDRVILGNESCAMTSGESWSSIPRLLMRQESTARGVYEQYRQNDFYWYPEHRDHDEVDYFHGLLPGLGVSQGSSGSEMDEVKRMVYVLAAFRPATKRALVAAGLLMPTLQMIFRRGRVASDEEYLTGAAHPSAFDDLSATMQMLSLASGMPPDAVPPAVQLEVLEETYAAVDGKNERWFTLPVSICRIFRGLEYTKRIRLSAAGSFDLNGRPLTVHWVVLRGDPAHVRIQPLGADGAIAEIEIDYHPKAPIGGTTRLSNRIDVGVFVHNGLTYSAPAFLTSYTLDHEARTYDQDGNLLERTTQANYVYPPLL
jgi:hypothetical protein